MRRRRGRVVRARNNYGNGSLTAGTAPQGTAGSGYYGSYSPNSYGNAGYGSSNSVPGYGAYNATGNYTAGYPPTTGYDASTPNRQSPQYGRNGVSRSSQAQANGTARPGGQGRTLPFSVDEQAHVFQQR